MVRVSFPFFSVKSGRSNVWKYSTNWKHRLLSQIRLFKIKHWNWTKPLCLSDDNFNAVIADKTGVNEYLKESESDCVKNTIIFLLLDRQILCGIKIIGLEGYSDEYPERYSPTLKGSVP